MIFLAQEVEVDSKIKTARCYRAVEWVLEAQIEAGGFSLYLITSSQPLLCELRVASLR